MFKSEIAGLARKAQKGNPKAFEELCAREAERIFMTAFGILGNRSDAEDAAQETILKIYQHIGSLKDPAAVDVWIMRIARNVCYDMLAGTIPEKNILDFDEAAGQIAEEDMAFIPEQYAVDSDLRKQLMEIVMGLPKKRRETIFMYYYDDMSTKEIASLTGTNVNTVTANLARARGMIRKVLDEQEAQGASLAFGAMAMAPAPASAATLGSVLKQSAAELFSPEVQTALHRQWMHAIHHVALPKAAATAAAAAAAHGAAATHIAVSVAVSAGIFAGAAYTAAQYDAAETGDADRTTTSIVQMDYGAQVEGEIVFAGGECDCGHLNPAAAHLVEREIAVAQATWDIKDTQTGQTLGAGTGTNVPGGLSDIGADGQYLLTFHAKDADGNIYSVERPFEIKTA
ncbi:MAG: sigma-70 family RNA polymerase sigma factor [Clostridiales Family XIII bacterium]|jgi:RNA polymerase sigma-70 factor (ECF subfamily)|nr:sigma-70 family RNA polymerase sigma factor [Clostridiales Family XIII bacterium]